jgi:hypothetical protein
VTDPVPDKRDIRLYETVLSGDLAGNDVPVPNPDAFLRESYSCKRDNSTTVVDAEGAGRAAVLEGVTVTGGGELGYYEFVWIGDAVGGGVQGGSPTLRMCTFRDNVTRYDGAAVCAEAPLITDCTFVGNLCGRLGDAVCARATLTHCTFIGNMAMYGGAVGSPRGTVDVANCLFCGNKALTSYPWDELPPAGGAIFQARGKIDGFPSTRGAARLVGCTFHANQAERGATIYNDQSVVSAVNCIFWDGPQAIFDTQGTATQVRYSDVQGGWLGESNIDVDPLFTALGRWDLNDTPDDPNDDRWVDGDYHLKSRAGRWDWVSGSWVTDDVTSPCIDAGDRGVPVGDEPQPNGGRINMGAYGGTAEASKSWSVGVGYGAAPIDSPTGVLTRHGR